jgi:prepilin-type N-terminal cleavage/methylation domain-containing protein
MRKGFTLLELIIVIVILGILATLGFAQYQRMAERARGAEARTIIGLVRTQAAGHRMQYGALSGAGIPAFNDAAAGIGATAELIPSACRPTHYFLYTVTSAVEPTLVTTATRCTVGGKIPDSPTALTLILTSNFGAGTDIWTGTGGY